jgi:hypothetical protein
MLEEHAPGSKRRVDRVVLVEEPSVNLCTNCHGRKETLKHLRLVLALAALACLVDGSEVFFVGFGAVVSCARGGRKETLKHTYSRPRPSSGSSSKVAAAPRARDDGADQHDPVDAAFAAGGVFTARSPLLLLLLTRR